jgi:hypothetical protein
MREMELTAPRPPQREASRIEAMRDLWRAAGLEHVETREIAVERRFADFDDFWMTSLKSPSLGPMLKALPAADIAALKSRVRKYLSSDSDGRITHHARANAVKGRRPG